MQSEAEAVRAAESCVLGAAERHMNAQEPCGGKCCGCTYFHEVDVSDELPRMVHRMLDYCGACDYFDDITIVDRSEWHSMDECFLED